MACRRNSSSASRRTRSETYCSVMASAAQVVVPLDGAAFGSRLIAEWNEAQALLERLGLVVAR